MFIHYNSSKNGRKRTAAKLLTHPFSAGCVGELLDFDKKLVNFLLKLVLPFILKDILSQFLSSLYFTFIAKMVTRLSFLVFLKFFSKPFISQL